MRFLFSVGGLIMFVGSLVLARFKWQDLKIQQEGEIVAMRIANLPDRRVGTKVKHHATFSYGNEKFIKQIPGLFCEEHSMGDTVNMKYLPGSNHILFPEESVISEIWSCVALSLLGLICFGQSLKRR